MHLNFTADSAAITCRYGYLHELLISKRGVPATLAVLLAHIMQRLLMRGCVDFAVRTRSQTDRSAHWTA